jgi:hypothetical protein
MAKDIDSGINYHSLGTVHAAIPRWLVGVVAGPGVYQVLGQESMVTLTQRARIRPCARPMNRTGG